MASSQRVALTLTLTYLSGSNLEPIANQQVTVTKRGGGAATVYNAASGGSAVTTILTDAQGNLNGSTYAYFVPEGSYLVNVPSSSSPSYAAFSVYYEALHGDGVGNLDPSVANLTGDVSGTLPGPLVVNTINGAVAVTVNTPLGGVLSGTFPNPQFASSAPVLFPGAIVEAAVAVPPVGFLYCNGGAVPRGTYPNLFNAMTTSISGVSFGSGTQIFNAIVNVTFQQWVMGVLGLQSINIGTIYSFQTNFNGWISPGIPMSGPGIAAGTYLSELLFDNNTTISVTISQNTTSIQGNSTLVFAPHGIGDGSTTFNLPDRRGRVAVGTGTGTAEYASQWPLGVAPIGYNTIGGEERHAMFAVENGVHNHGGLTQPGESGSTAPGIQDPGHGHGYSSYSSNVPALFDASWAFFEVAPGTSGKLAPATPGGGLLTPTSTLNSGTGISVNGHTHDIPSLGIGFDGQGEAHNNMPPAYVNNFFIKY